MKIVTIKERVYRVAAVAPDREKLLQAGIEIDEAGINIPSNNDATININYTFLNPSQSRFTDGSYPVLYTAQEAMTARTEKGYWVYELLLKKKYSPKKWVGQEYSMEIEGSAMDIACDDEFRKEYVNPDSKQYASCWRVAKIAIDNDVDAIKAKSARKRAAINYPIFKKEVLSGVNINGRLEYYVDGGELKCQINGSCDRIVFDNVFDDIL